MASGKLITIEGIDGAGKTTLASMLLAALQGRGVAARLLREPGGVRTAELIRELVTSPALEIGARAEALMYAAARAQLVEEAIKPQLAEGMWVLLDRFVDSSLAYQGGGRRLGVEPVRAINRFATGTLVPDVTLLLAIDPELGRRRSAARLASPDRLELEDDGFFERIANTYSELAAAEPQRIRAIDAAQAPEAVLAAALAAIDSA